MPRMEWDTSGKAASIDDQLYSKICNLLRVTISTQMEKIKQAYDESDDLAARVSERTFFTYETEYLFFLLHITDVMLFNRQPSYRDHVMISLYNEIKNSLNLQDFFPNTALQPFNLIDDRLEQYALIARGDLRPAASCFLGVELPDDTITQCLAQVGDYILYALKEGKIPLKADVEPVLITSVFDCELLVLPIVITRFFSPGVQFYVERLARHLSSLDELPQGPKAKKSVGVPLLVWLVSFSLIFFIIVLCLVSPPSSDYTAGGDSSGEAYTVDHPAMYVGSANSNIVHKANCPHVKNISNTNKVYYQNLENAEKDGRIQCSTCLSDTNSNAGSNSGTSGNSISSSSRNLSPLTPPANGRILYENGEDRVAPLTIKTKGSGYYYIKLKDSSGNDVIRFFVHGDKTVDIDVPLGEYTLVYATGDSWYGSVYLFGEETRYAKAEDLLEFYEDGDTVYGWTIELYLQSNGNLETASISADEF